MKPLNFLLAFGLFVLLTSCVGQSGNPPQKDFSNSPIVGGVCDGCELMYIGMPDHIAAIDTSIGWSEASRKLQVNGTVLRSDGKTPAGNIVIYYWHTNEEGVYAGSDEMDDRHHNHGSLRGWVKSDSNGSYTIYTSRPGPYPNGAEPEHIHFIIKEPEVSNEYYIDDLVFADDPVLKSTIEKKYFPQRGGSGIVEISDVNGVQVVNHKITLGLNIPDYPDKSQQGSNPK